MVYDRTGTNPAHGTHARLIGENLIELKDADGEFMGKGFLDTAYSPAGKGWMDDKWPHPLTKALEQKSTDVEKCEDRVIGVGIDK